MITQKYTWFFILVLLIILQSQFCQAQTKNKGVPFIKNYTTDDYHAHDQNWFLTQDQRGVLYAGNSSGLLEFDGVRWRLMDIPNKSTVRSVMLGKDGVVYVGAQNFLGYVATDSTGKTYVASLMDQIPKEVAGFKDIWHMVETDEGVACRSRIAVFVVKNKKIQVVKPQKTFSAIAVVNKKAYVREPGIGTFKLENGKLTEDTLFKKKVINHGFPWGNNKSLLMIFIRPHIYDGKTLTPFARHLDKFFRKNSIYCAAQIDKNHLAIGTESGGIVIINQEGKVIQHLHKGNGLQDNSIYHLFVDKHKNLWAGLSRGISFIELNSPFSVLDETTGLEGSVYYTHVHGSRLFAGTSQGIFYKNWLNYENPLKDSVQFKAVPDMINQIWQFKTFKNRLLTAYNPGTLRFKDLQKQVKPQAFKGANGNVWTIIPLKNHPDLLLTGGKRGLQILEWKNKQWQWKHAVKGFSKNSRYVQEGEPGTIWMSFDQTGVYRLKLNATLDSVVNTTFYDTTKGLPSNTHNRVFRVNDQNLFATENGVYVYDKTKDRFVKETKLNKLIGGNKTEFTNSTRLMLIYLRSDAQQNIWYVSQAVHNGIKDKFLEVGMLQKQANGDYKKIMTPFRKLQGSFIEKVAPHLNPIDRQNIIFATKEGMVHYDPTQQLTTSPFAVLLREVLLTGAKDSVIFWGTFTNAQGQMLLKPDNNYSYPALSHRYNGLRFNVSSTFYADNHKNEFRYWLEGLDQKWSAWTKETYKEYTNLREGNYVLHVQTRNLYQSISPELTYKFKIFPPWHRTVWAYVAYVIVGVLLVMLTIKLYTRRLTRQRDKLERTVEERTAEIRTKNDEILLKNSELEQQKEEILIQAENLRDANAAIEHKNTELTEKSNEIEGAYQNVKLLSEIGQEITSKLSLTQIVESVYNNVNNLMDVAEFGIGLYNTNKHIITFRDYIHLNEKMPEVIIPATDQNRFGVLCVMQQKEIMVNDVYEEYHQYVKSLDSYDKGELLSAFICIPLIVEHQTIGLVSVQSLKTNVYTNYHLNLLRNLAVYITIALQNTDSYSKIELQKSRIETQNQEITASIRYAQKIQAAILPSKKSFENIFSDYFVIYEPKDIVSGDFYWLSHVKKRLIIDDVPSFKIYTFVAAVDCTGHGVPGAFMSMIGSRLLSEIVNEKKILDPQKILTKLQVGIQKGLNQKESDNNDGMDICLCRVEYIEDSSEVEVIYSNAKRPLYYTKEQTLQKIKGDRVFIGGWMPKQMSQTLQNHTIQLNRDDILYLSSDGFVDTPNNKRKSFGTRRLIDVLEEIMNQPLDVQKEQLLKAKADFQEDADQRDDIVMLGIKL